MLGYWALVQIIQAEGFKLQVPRHYLGHMPQQ